MADLDYEPPERSGAYALEDKTQFALFDDLRVALDQNLRITAGHRLDLIGTIWELYVTAGTLCATFGNQTDAAVTKLSAHAGHILAPYRAEIRRARREGGGDRSPAEVRQAQHLVEYRLRWKKLEDTAHAYNPTTTFSGTERYDAVLEKFRMLSANNRALVIGELTEQVSGLHALLDNPLQQSLMGTRNSVTRYGEMLDVLTGIDRELLNNELSSATSTASTTTKSGGTVDPPTLTIV